MKQYQNLQQDASKSTFIEIGTFSGDEVHFTARRPKSMINGQEVNFAKAGVTVTKPHTVTNCATQCTAGQVTESMRLEFNLVSIEAYDVLKAELDRVLALTKASLIHGVLPPAYSSFKDE